MRPSPLLRRHLLAILLSALCCCHNSAAEGPRPMTRGECLAIERSNSIRRSAKAVISVEGSPAYLHCPTAPAGVAAATGGDHLVAWTRLSDNSLLTAGGQTFTTDTRFQISQKREARDWVLIIRRVQPSDQGCYLCEINSEPISTLVLVYLEVTSSRDGEGKGALNATSNVNAKRRRSNLVTKLVNGNTLLLNCSVASSAGGGLAGGGADRFSIVDLMWTRDNTPIDLYDESKYSTDYQVSSSGELIYMLSIFDVSPADNGLYACEGDEIIRSAQMVHVSDDRGTDGFNGATSISLLTSLTFLPLVIAILFHTID